MEKSIESIWKQGFLKNDALVAPKINDLYNKKSIHLIDKFKRMFKINLNVIIVGSLLFLGLSFLIGIPITGIGCFVTLILIVIINSKLSRGLDKIDMSESSYHYIKAFDKWMNEQANVNRALARFYYPMFFLSIVLGIWYSSFDDKQFGEAVRIQLMSHYPDIYLVFGVPIVIILAVIIVTVFLAYFGGRIYTWDLKVVYGDILKKLDEIITDMEELRN